MILSIFTEDILKLSKIFLEYNKSATLSLSIKVTDADVTKNSFYHSLDNQENGRSILEYLNFKSQDLEKISFIRSVSPLLKSISIDIPVVHVKELSETLSKILSKGTKIKLDADVFPSLIQTRSIIFANEIQMFGYTGKNVRIAVLDTGVDQTHPDLHNVKKNVNLSSAKHELDSMGHGTHVAGIIGGQGVIDNAVRGIAPEVEIYSFKVLPGTVSSVAKGIEEAINLQVDAINLSLGLRCDEEAVYYDDYEAATVANSRGIAVVAAAGNEGPSNGTVGSPACNPDVIAVGAVDKEKRIAKYSSRGPIRNIIKPDIVAPGGYVRQRTEEAILSTKSKYYDSAFYWNVMRDEYYVYMQGTSMATPHVSGAVALTIHMLREKGYTSSATKKQELKLVKALLFSTATPLGYPKHVEGFGLVNLKNIYTRINSGDLPRDVPRLEPDKSVPSVKRTSYPPEVIHSLLKIIKTYDLTWLGKIGRDLLEAAKNGANALEVAPLFTKYQLLSPLVSELKIIEKVEEEYYKRDILLLDSIKYIIHYHSGDLMIA